MKLFLLLLFALLPHLFLMSLQNKIRNHMKKSDSETHAFHISCI